MKGRTDPNFTTASDTVDMVPPAGVRSSHVIFRDGTSMMVNGPPGRPIPIPLRYERDMRAAGWTAVR